MLPILDSLRSDLVFGWRRLLQSKVTTTAAVLSLALAMGACLSVFRLVDSLLLRPLPVSAPGRLYVLSRQEFDPHGKSTVNDYWQYPLNRRMRDVVQQDATVLAISYAERVELTFGSDQDMERAHVQYVSGDTFATFGLKAAAGRVLTGNDDLVPGAQPQVVLSYDYWSRRFGRDPQVVGRTFRMGNNLTGIRVYQIVGVLGEGFSGTEPGRVIDVFLPSMMHWAMPHPEWGPFRTLVQLHPGAAVGPVQDRLRVVLRAFDEEKARHPQTLITQSAAAGVSEMQQNYRLSLGALTVLVMLVLLIACANVANLMTGQAAGRAREMALRVSIGAGRGRLVQLVLVESALLGLSASALAWWFARWVTPFLVGRINPPDNPARFALSTDWRVVVFSLALTLGVTLLFGLAPALRASAVRPAAALKGGESPRSRGSWMQAMVAAQAAFSIAVLLFGGLFVTTLDRLLNQPTGFNVDNLVNLTIVNLQNEPSSKWDQVVEAVRRIPGVASAAYSDWPLLDGYGFKTNAISINDGPPTSESGWFLNVSPGWLATMKIPLIDGRDFRPSDLSPGAAIVSEAFAREFFNQENPIGKSFVGTSGFMRGQRFQIVGLVRDARYRYLREPNLPVAYTPFQRLDAKGTMQGGTLVVRTFGVNPVALESVLRKEVTRARPEFRVSNIRTQLELDEAQVVRERLLAMLARFFAMVALLLAAVGLYGVLDYSVWQRRREIGIRMALGAQAQDVAMRVTANILTMVVLGLVAGLALGLVSVRYVATLLYEVKATEPGILAMPAFALLGATLLAAIPAVIRAVKIDPAELLRAE